MSMECFTVDVLYTNNRFTLERHNIIHISVSAETSWWIQLELDIILTLKTCTPTIDVICQYMVSVVDLDGAQQPSPPPPPATLPILIDYVLFLFLYPVLYQNDSAKWESIKTKASRAHKWALDPRHEGL